MEKGVEIDCVFGQENLRMIEVPSANLNLDVLVDSVIEIENRMTYVAEECSELGGLLQAHADRCALEVGRLLAREGVGFRINRFTRDCLLNPMQKYEFVGGYMCGARSVVLEKTKQQCRDVLHDYWNLVRKHERLMRMHAKTWSVGMEELVRKTHAEKVYSHDSALVVLYYDLRRDNDYLIQAVDLDKNRIGDVRKQKVAVPEGYERLVMEYAGKDNASVYLVRNYSVKVSAEEAMGHVVRRLQQRHESSRPDAAARAKRNHLESLGIARAEQSLQAGSAAKC